MYTLFSRRRIAYLFSALVLLSLLGGCSTFFGKHGVFRGRGNDYLRAVPIKTIKLPEGVESVSLEPMFAVPEVQATDEFGDPIALEEVLVPRPEPIGDKSEVGVKIQKLGGEQWIYINASTAQVWPRTQYFLAEYDMDVASSNAKAGVIETEWLQFSDDKENAVRFRIVLEKGIHPETTEIHVLHMERPESLVRENPRVPWSETSDDPEREAWVMKELANSLAMNVNNSAASLLGQNVGGELKVEFTRYDNEPALGLRLNTLRAWATVSHAANQEGFRLWDEDSELGLLYVGYAPPDGDEKGFFSRLAFWSKDEKLPEKAPATLTDLLANLENNRVVRSRFASVPGAQFTELELNPAPGYLIVMHEEAGEVMVNIRDSRGDVLPDPVAKDFLRILRNNLI